MFQMSNIMNSGVKTDDHLQLVNSDGVLFGKLLFNSTNFVDGTLYHTQLN